MRNTFLKTFRKIYTDLAQKLYAHDPVQERSDRQDEAAARA